MAGLVVSVLLVACQTGAPMQPTVVISTNLSASATAIMENQLPSATAELSATSIPATIVPVTPEPTSTPSPTPFPAPFLNESVIGIELAGDNFARNSDKIAAVGANWARWNGIFWSSVEPLPGERNWESQGRIEEQLAFVNSTGLHLITIVRSTPEWAQQVPGYYCGPIAPDYLDDFGDFMFDLVSRYSQEPFNIKYWEIWNEPDIPARFVAPDNMFGCWGDTSDAYYGGGYYAEMLKAVYPRIKEADPEAQLLVGGLVVDCNPNDRPETFPGSGVYKECSASHFLEGILINGGGDYFDGVSFHAYDYYDGRSRMFNNANWHVGYDNGRLVPAVVPKTRFLKSLLASYGYFNKLLLNTETSLICGVDGKEPACLDASFDRMKGRYIPMTTAAALSEGLVANIWFNLDDRWRGVALTDSKFTRTLALQAYQVATEHFNEAVYWGPVTELPGVTGYKFRKGDIEMWVVWSLDGHSRQVNLMATPFAIVSPFGEELIPSAELEIDVEPLYIYWEP